MAVPQIGTRLVRQFDEGGKNCKIVLSETLNGKTFTKVLDSNGNTILDRVKKIDRYDVGNKKVSTITKVSQGADSPLKKQVTDRVYNAESGLLGIRRTDFADIGKDCNKLVKQFVTKRSIAGNIEIRKKFSPGGTTHGRTFINNFYKLTLFHNNKGLPMPKGASPMYMTNKKLADMRRWHLEHNPENPYAPSEFRLGYLNKPGVLETLNNLDKFF